jgi:hypothetical protein
VLVARRNGHDVEQLIGKRFLAVPTPHHHLTPGTQRHPMHLSRGHGDHLVEIHRNRCLPKVIQSPTHHRAVRLQGERGLPSARHRHHVAQSARHLGRISHRPPSAPGANPAILEQRHAMVVAGGDRPHPDQVRPHGGLSVATVAPGGHRAVRHQSEGELEVGAHLNHVGQERRRSEVGVAPNNHGARRKRLRHGIGHRRAGQEQGHYEEQQDQK